MKTSQSILAFAITQTPEDPNEMNTNTYFIIGTPRLIRIKALAHSHSGCRWESLIPGLPEVKAKAFIGYTIVCHKIIMQILLQEKIYLRKK